MRSTPKGTSIALSAIRQIIAGIKGVKEAVSTLAWRGNVWHLFACLQLILFARADQLPAGSYQQTCRNISVDKFKTLHASCRHPSGAWIDGASLHDVDKCIGDIFNFNGILECSRAQIPDGSYRNSCTDVFVDSQVITAKCRDSNGGTRPTTLDLNRCSHPPNIRNVDGYLACDVSNLPAGSYRDTCKDFAVAGSTVSAWCRQTSGKYVHTSLDFKDCLGPNSDIANREGSLICTASTPTGGGHPPPPPPGCPYHPEACPTCPPLCPPGSPQYPGTPTYPFARTKAAGKILLAPTATCKGGFVWREAVPGDYVCVSPDVRERAVQDNRSAGSRVRAAGSDVCKSGYVWRLAVAADHVCVTPEVRSQTAFDNQHASERKK
jgi:hypothetical protein